jgi:DNA repair exonuclease SbcCD ATPase subunit
MEKAKSIYESAERTVETLRNKLLELEQLMERTYRTEHHTIKALRDKIEVTKRQLLSAEECLSNAEDIYGDYLGCDIYESAERVVKRIRDELVKLEEKHAAGRIEYARLVQNYKAGLFNSIPNPTIYYSLQIANMEERLENRLEVNQELNHLRLEREALKQERLTLESQKNQLRETMESLGWDEIILLKPK